LFDEGTKKRLFSLEGTAGTASGTGQRRNIFTRIVSHGILFQVSPNILDRVEIGRIRRKEEGVEGGYGSEKRACLSSQVGIEPVPYKHNRRLELAAEDSEEVGYDLCIDIGFRMEAKVQIETVPLGGYTECGNC
jgi:hypothetical protein